MDIVTKLYLPPEIALYQKSILLNMRATPEYNIYFNE